MVTWIVTLVVAVGSVVIATAIVAGGPDAHAGHLAAFVVMCVTLVGAVVDGRRRGLAVGRVPKR